MNGKCYVNSFRFDLRIQGTGSWNPKIQSVLLNVFNVLITEEDTLRTLLIGEDMLRTLVTGDLLHERVHGYVIHWHYVTFISLPKNGSTGAEPGEYYSKGVSQELLINIRWHNRMNIRLWHPNVIEWDWSQMQCCEAHSWLLWVGEVQRNQCVFPRGQVCPGNGLGPSAVTR